MIIYGVLINEENKVPKVPSLLQCGKDSLCIFSLVPRKWNPLYDMYWVPSIYSFALYCKNPKPLIVNGGP